MSSEMRELIAKWRAVAEKQRGMASRDNERGDLECAARMAGMAERTEYMADELEALLTRTEAGADRPVAEISELSGAKLIVLYSADEIGHLPKGTKLYTHPQDASGDAEVAVAALLEIYETGMYPEGHTLAGEHAYKGEYHADCIGIAERALAAMQAKEAK